MGENLNEKVKDKVLLLLSAHRMMNSQGKIFLRVGGI